MVTTSAYITAILLTLHSAQVAQSLPAPYHDTQQVVLLKPSDMAVLSRSNADSDLASMGETIMDCSIPCGDPEEYASSLASADVHRGDDYIESPFCISCKGCQELAEKVSLVSTLNPANDVEEILVKRRLHLGPVDKWLGGAISTMGKGAFGFAVKNPITASIAAAGVLGAGVFNVVRHHKKGSDKVKRSVWRGEEGESLPTYPLYAHDIVPWSVDRSASAVEEHVLDSDRNEFESRRNHPHTLLHDTHALTAHHLEHDGEELQLAKRTVDLSKTKTLPGLATSKARFSKNKVIAIGGAGVIGAVALLGAATAVTNAKALLSTRDFDDEAENEQKLTKRSVNIGQVASTMKNSLKLVSGLVTSTVVHHREGVMLAGGIVRNVALGGAGFAVGKMVYDKKDKKDQSSC